MTITFSTKNLVRWLLFVAVFVGVMSIAPMVDARGIPTTPVHARDLPTPTVHGVTVTVETLVADTTSNNDQAMFEMADVPDGLASCYGRPFHGRRTASGRRFDMNELTAAHRSLPFGSLVQVENSTTGKVIMVEITDRGPFIRRRVIDLSYAAARELGVSVTPVKLCALTPNEVRAFYIDNDSTLLVVDDELNVRVRPLSELTIVGELDPFTTAMREREANEDLIIRPAERNLNFQRARLASDIANN